MKVTCCVPHCSSSGQRSDDGWFGLVRKDAAGFLYLCPKHTAQVHEAVDQIATVLSPEVAYSAYLQALITARLRSYHQIDPVTGAKKDR